MNNKNGIFAKGHETDICHLLNPRRPIKRQGISVPLGEPQETA